MALDHLFHPPRRNGRNGHDLPAPRESLPGFSKMPSETALGRPSISTSCNPHLRLMQEACKSCARGLADSKLFSRRWDRRTLEQAWFVRRLKSSRKICKRRQFLGLFRSEKC